MSELEYVTLRRLAKDKDRIKEDARKAVEAEIDAGNVGPRAISRKTGIPVHKVVQWSLLKRDSGYEK